MLLYVDWQVVYCTKSSYSYVLLICFDVYTFKNKVIIYRCTNTLCCKYGVFKYELNQFFNHYLLFTLFLVNYSLKTNMNSIHIRLPFKLANNGVLYQKVLICISCLMKSYWNSPSHNRYFIYFYKLFPTSVKSFQTSNSSLINPFSLHRRFKSLQNICPFAVCQDFVFFL